MATSAVINSIDGFELTYETGTDSCRCMYESTERNRRGERLVVEVVGVEDDGGPYSMGRTWKRLGLVPRIYPTRHVFHTFVYDEAGNCREAYNPTIKESEDGGRYVIDFDWMDEASEEHARLVFAEIRRRFMAA